MSDQFDSNQTAAGCPSGRSLSQSEDAPASNRPKVRKISSLCAKIKELYHLNTTDVNFVFDVDGNDELVPAHKCILAFHSPVFRQMFYGELKEKGDIKLTDTTIVAFIDMMICMHRLQLTIDGSQPKIEPLLGLAHKYDINWLETECKRILGEIIIKNVIAILWVLPLANLYSYDDLQRKCIELIRKHGNSIVESAEFVDCESEMVKEILRIDFVNRNEVSVFEICIKWAEKACKNTGLDAEMSENIRKHLNDCFDLIRFESMTQKQFLQCLSINPGLFTLSEIQSYASHLCKAKPNNGQNQPNLAVGTSEYQIVSPFNTVKSSLQMLLEDQSTADVTFIFKNDAHEVVERISAHKCILAFRSFYFSNKFKDSTNSNEITIAGVSAETFMYFLRLIYVLYKNQISAILEEIDDHHIDALLSLNREYFGTKLSYRNNLYTSHLIKSLNEQNVIRRFELAHKYSLDELKTKFVDLMKKKGEQIISSDAFMDCNQENLKVILELGIWEGEKSMAVACIKWAKKYYKIDSADAKDIRMAMGDLFALIPFAAMDPLVFIDFQREYSGMLTDGEILKVIKDFADRRIPNPV